LNNTSQFAPFFVSLPNIFLPTWFLMLWDEKATCRISTQETRQA
jgi:hypothetical protein